MRTANWHRALDVQMDSLKFFASEWGKIATARHLEQLHLNALEALGRETNPEYKGILRESSERDAHDVAVTLHRGDTCFITSEMLQLALQAAHDMPNDQIAVDFRNLMSPIGFLLFEEGIHGQDRNGIDCAFNAIAWNANLLHFNHDTEQVERGLQLYFFTDTSDPSADNEDFREVLGQYNIPVPPLSLLHIFTMFDGHIIKHFEGPGYEIVEELLKVWYSIQLLSHQTIGTPVRLDPDRGSRRRFAREFPYTPIPMITLITLRRKTVKKDDDEEPARIEWQSRWVVRGHWRKQWYPSLQRHDWKYIHEYVKGPEDKPLRLTERRVFDFRR